MFCASAHSSFAALPVLERVEHRVRGAADEVELAVAQVLVGLGDRVEQLQLRVEEAELDRGDAPGSTTARSGRGWRGAASLRLDSRGLHRFLPESRGPRAIACANSAGVPHTGSTPILFRRSTKAASLQPAAISRAMRSTTSRGVAAGAT